MTNIFISHAHDDAEFANSLAHQLAEQGMTVWHPEHHLHVGKHWANAIEEAIRDADNVLVVLSRNSANSEWVHAEMALALSQAGKRVVPVFSTQNAATPFLLRGIQGVDLSNPDTFQTSVDRLVHLLRKAPLPPQSDIDEDRHTRVLKIQLEASLLAHEQLSLEHSNKLKTRALAISTFFIATASAAVSGLFLVGAIFADVSPPAAFLTGVTAGLAGAVTAYLLYRARRNSEAGE